MKIDYKEIIKERLETNVNMLVDSECVEEVSCICGNAFEDILLAYKFDFITEENMDELADQVCTIADKRIKELTLS